MPVEAIMIVVAALATVAFAVWALRLRAAGDPAWKLAGATGLLCIAAGLIWTRPDSIAVVGVSVLFTAAAMFWIMSFGRDRRRKAP